MIAQTCENAVPERALQIAADGGRWCSGGASGVVGAVDRWLSGPASRSSAKAVITQMLLRDAVPSGHCRSPPTWVGDVVDGRVSYWVPWIADYLLS